MLATLGVTFEVRASDSDEQPDGSPPAQLAETLALRKTRAVAAVEGSDAAVLGADTIVVLDGALLGKPLDRSEERRVGKECRSRWSPYH